MEKAPKPDRGYPDLHDHLKLLDKLGLLITVDRPINKDTELHPLVRWQFRGGIDEGDRKAFLFTNVIDSKGRKYDIPVAGGVLAASKEIYRAGIGCELEGSVRQFHGHRSRQYRRQQHSQSISYSRYVSSDHTNNS